MPASHSQGVTGYVTWDVAGHLVSFNAQQVTKMRSKLFSFRTSGHGSWCLPAPVSRPMCGGGRKVRNVRPRVAPCFNEGAVTASRTGSSLHFTHYVSTRV